MFWEDVRENQKWLEFSNDDCHLEIDVIDVNGASDTGL